MFDGIKGELMKRIKFFKLGNLTLGYCFINKAKMIAITYNGKTFSIDLGKIRNPLKGFHVMPMYFQNSSTDCDGYSNDSHFMTLNYLESKRIFNQLKRDCEGGLCVYRIKEKNYLGETVFDRFLRG